MRVRAREAAVAAREAAAVLEAVRVELSNAQVKGR